MAQAAAERCRGGASGTTARLVVQGPGGVQARAASSGGVGGWHKRRQAALLQPPQLQQRGLMGAHARPQSALLAAALEQELDRHTYSSSVHLGCCRHCCCRRCCCQRLQQRVPGLGATAAALDLHADLRARLRLNSSHPSQSLSKQSAGHPYKRMHAQLPPPLPLPLLPSLPPSPPLPPAAAGRENSSETSKIPHRSLLLPMAAMTCGRQAGQAKEEQAGWGKASRRADGPRWGGGEPQSS